MKVFILIQTTFLLICSNTFMTFAWYSHLRNWNDKKWYIAALLSWGIAFFEYLFQVPANRTGYTIMNLAQLKVLQEVVTLLVFLPFVVLYMHQAVRLNYLWAGLCLVGAVFFMFRS
ncbi:MAG: uncharacterized protein QOF93_578 [Verrucomicrobiota bacterium]|jgi:uncharacterized protein